MSEYPLITNAIPLFRSKRFVDVIIANIEAIEYPNTEIIISDRHQYDDAIDILAAYFEKDPRVTILKAKDELSFAGHCNLLLFKGHGKYFRWMPHDDSYPRCCLMEKVKILEAHPEIVLVNGPWHVLDVNENVAVVRHPMKSRLGRWSYETSLFIAFGDYEAHAFKGLFRRDIPVQKGIFLFDTPRIISPERCWEFAMSLTGEFNCYPDFAYHKHYYQESTHAGWRQAWRPMDILFNWYYKFRYQWKLDRKPGRIIVFLLFMAPLTFYQILCDKTSGVLHKVIHAFPGKVIKRWIRVGLARL